MKLCTPEEVSLNEAFKAAGIRVQYEPKTFRSRGRRTVGFRPDFYLPDLDMYVEVGELHRKSKKMRMMKNSHKNTRIIVIDNSEIPIFAGIDYELLEPLLLKCLAFPHIGMGLEKRLKYLRSFIQDLAKT